MDKLIQGNLFGDIFPDMPQKKAAVKRLQPVNPHLPPHRVIRNTRRTKNVVAYRKGGIIEIHIPSRIPREDEVHLIPEMISRVLSQESARATGTDTLWEMAREILEIHLHEVTKQPESIEWATMNERWGSCTPVDASIRISHRLAMAPNYVIRSVLFHELIHLLIHNHSKEFYMMLSRNPDQERSEAFLEGYEYSAAHNNPFVNTQAIGSNLPKMA